MPSTLGMRTVKGGELIDVSKCYPSSHLIIRMYQRDAIWSTILAVILHGQEINIRSPRVAKLRGFGWDVLIDGHKVVTVHQTGAPVVKQKKRRTCKEEVRVNGNGDAKRRRSKLHRLHRLLKKEAMESFFLN